MRVLYRVVSGNDYHHLEEEVNECIKEGWTPQGGIAIGKVGDVSHFYTQAMIRTI